MVGMSTTQYVTTDSVIGTSGARTRVFQATWLSDGTARDLQLRNGATDSATLFTSAAGVISKTVTLIFGTEGLVFPAGCFVDIGSAVSVAVTYRVEL